MIKPYADQLDAAAGRQSVEGVDAV